MNRNFYGMNLNVTMILIIINMVVFMAVHLLAMTGNSWLIDSLPLDSSILTTILHPWTLITSMFMHWDIWHFFMNMLALFFIGQYIESILGTRRYLITYFAGGIAGGIFYVLFALFPLSLLPALGVSGHSFAVGASGAIFGIFAALAVMRPNQLVYLFPLPVPITLPVAVMLSFFAAMFVFGGMTSVANSAHLGGIAGGVICGYYFRNKSRPLYEYDEYGNIYRY